MASDELTPEVENPKKDSEDWNTDEEVMTGPQCPYLQTVCREAGGRIRSNLTNAEASRKVEDLQANTGRGKK